MKRMFALIVLTCALSALAFPAVAGFEQPRARWTLFLEGHTLALPGLPALPWLMPRLVKDGSAYNPDG